MAEFEIGDLGWAKMKGYPHWPAVIIEPTEKVKPPKSKEPMYWVKFFGTNDNSWVTESNILPFEEGRSKYENKSVTGNFKKAYAEIMDYVKKNPQRERKVHTPKTNGIPVSSDSSFGNLSFSTPKQKITQKVSPNKRASKSADSTKKKRRASDESSLSSEYNSSIKERYSILLNDSSEEYLCAKNYKKDSYNYEMEFGLKVPTLELINRQIPEIPVVPHLNLTEKSEKMQKVEILPTTLKIGFLGLGYMGRAMVKNLLQTQHHVTIWNRTYDKCEEFRQYGASVGKTPADVVQASDIIFSCLSDRHAAKHIVFCNYGVLESMKPGKGYIDMTSLDPETSHSISEAVNHKGGKYLEVPALGTRNHAKDGTLILLAAGDDKLFNNAFSCFKAISKNIFYLGEVGKASKMNLVISMVMGACFTAVSEAMNLADRSDISLKQVVEVLERRDLKCPAIIDQARAIVNNTTREAQIPLQYVQKNLHLALELGDQYSQPLPTTSAANEVFKHVKRMGYGDHDVAALCIRGQQ